MMEDDKAPITAEPSIDRPVVQRTGQFRREIGIVVAGDMAVVAEGEDGAPNIATVQNLPAERFEIGSWRTAIGRKSVGTHETVRVRQPILHGERHDPGRSAI